MGRSVIKGRGLNGESGTGSLMMAGALALGLAAGASTVSAHPASLPDAPGAGSALATCGSGAAAEALAFWYGEWTVEVGGNQVGTNLIEPVLGGCGVTELWRDQNGGEGRSLFYYVAIPGEWRQVWVTPDPFSPGGVKEKRMVPAEGAPEGSVRFQGNVPTPSGRVWLDRTTLTPLEGGRVRQHIEISPDDGETWSTTFDALYIPVRSEGAEPRSQ